MAVAAPSGLIATAGEKLCGGEMLAGLRHVPAGVRVAAWTTENARLPAHTAITEPLGALATESCITLGGRRSVPIVFGCLHLPSVEPLAAITRVWPVPGLWVRTAVAAPRALIATPSSKFSPPTSVAAGAKRPPGARRAVSIAPAPLVPPRRQARTVAPRAFAARWSSPGCAPFGERRSGALSERPSAPTITASTGLVGGLPSHARICSPRPSTTSCRSLNP